ncbi:hypothetical protein QH494_13205 [Sphingomonas sp. AR_OL41]|uniref:hypothetical protein n=1 Tax=Sphingomonas sp. AR_OL41 TaxID=3042729 RepID=UPI0024800224|nr:hypothetical protein [Sphingomonas sp. AR_OL41]MDH7973140.1 hypothetical protein [Sphingomonas sp. AR_OL41]
MSENEKANPAAETDPAETVKAPDVEDPTPGTIPDGPTRSDQVGEKPLIAPGKSGL